MSVGNGHSEALSGDVGRGGGNYLVAHDLAPDLEGLLLALLLLAADERNNVVDYLGHGLKGLARAADSLIGAGESLRYLEFVHEGSESGNVALERAVGLDCDKSALGAETLSLGSDDLDVLGIDLGDHHGNVGSMSVS